MQPWRHVGPNGKPVKQGVKHQRIPLERYYVQQAGWQKPPAAPWQQQQATQPAWYCGSCGTPHGNPSCRWCRAERQRLAKAPKLVVPKEPAPAAADGAPAAAAKAHVAGPPKLPQCLKSFAEVVRCGEEKEDGDVKMEAADADGDAAASRAKARTDLEATIATLEANGLVEAASQARDKLKAMEDSPKSEASPKKQLDLATRHAKLCRGGVAEKERSIKELREKIVAEKAALKEARAALKVADGGAGQGARGLHRLHLARGRRGQSASSGQASQARPRTADVELPCERLEALTAKLQAVPGQPGFDLEKAYGEHVVAHPSDQPPAKGAFVWQHVVSRVVAALAEEVGAQRPAKKPATGDKPNA